MNGTTSLISVLWKWIQIIKNPKVLVRIQNYILLENKNEKIRRFTLGRKQKACFSIAELLFYSFRINTV
jgi:hypothetical protein